MIRWMLLSMALIVVEEAEAGRSLAHEWSSYGSVGVSQPRALASEPTAILKGRITKLSGDFMPTRNPGGPTGLARPLSVPVYIVRGTVSSGTGSEIQIPDQNDPSLLSKVVKVVNADENGEYRVENLPAGKYTVFALIDNQLVSNEFDGLNHYYPQELKSGEVTRADIKDNRDATN